MANLPRAVAILLEHLELGQDLLVLLLEEPYLRGAERLGGRHWRATPLARGPEPEVPVAEPPFPLPP